MKSHASVSQTSTKMLARVVMIKKDIIVLGPVAYIIQWDL